MSSVYCENCQNMIWDKNLGYTKGSNEIHKNKDQWISICGKCKTKTVYNYTDFDKRYGLNKPKDQINMIKVKQMIDNDHKNNYWNTRRSI